MSHNLYKLELGPDELVIYDIARAFFGMTNGRNDNHGMRFYSTKDPRTHGSWRYFHDLYETVKNDGFFNIRWFIKAQLSHLTKTEDFWPAQLLTKKAFKYYFEYCESRKVIIKSDRTQDIMYGLAQDKKIIQEWFSDHNTDSYKELFDHVAPGLVMSDGTYYAMQGMISILFLSISKTFKATYSKLDADLQQEIASKGQLILTRNKIKDNERTKAFANKIFGDEVTV